MKETWRWFGPQDRVSLDHVRQAGATGVVSALHHLYRGEVWPLDEVLKRKSEIEAAGLTWSVVESIPIHNSIKLQSGPFRQFTDAWKDSLSAIVQAGVKIVCYNFMPVVDWTRTDLRWQLSSTGYALRFDVSDFAAYDVFILQRVGAEGDYPEERVAAAQARFEAMSEGRRNELEQTIIAGLPGAEGSYDRGTLRESIDQYKNVTTSELRGHLISFLWEVAPVAEELGVRLAIHPDDPPWPLFGLPRVVSTAEDARSILAGVDTAASTWFFDEPVTALTLTDRPEVLAVVLGSRVILWEPATDTRQEPLFCLEGWPAVRLNDARVDPRGSLWMGTMRNNVNPDGTSSEAGEKDGVLFRLDPDAKVSVWRRDIGIANTLTWSPDRRRFYFGDSLANVIWQYDYDASSGTIENERPFLAGFERGAPDGSAMDSEGYLWNCRFFGGCIVRVAPDGKIDRVVEMPVQNITTCTFGGADRKTLYVTTAKAEAPAGDRLAGGLYAIQTEVVGQAENSFRAFGR